MADDTMPTSADDGEDRDELPASTPEEVQTRHESNRLAWNEGAVWYTQFIDEDVEFITGGGSSVHSIERNNLGDLSTWCHTAIHLQCASGRDTLSLLNEGAKEVIGVDISDLHIENARRTSERLGAPARWYRCDVLDTPHDLDGMADLVYTGRGAICWIHDIDRWAAVVYRLLKPGGKLHLLEDHPVIWLFEIDAETLVPSNNNYFAHGESSKGWPDEYIGVLEIAEENQSRKYERVWPISTIVGALRKAGLIIELVGEYSESYWPVFSKLKPELRATLPLTLAIMASKPRS